VLTDAPAVRAPARVALARATVGLGLLLIVVGTFLPWLHSGRATRNSYATDGAVRRLLDVNGGLDAALRAWPFVSLLCAIAVALLLLGQRVLGVVLALLAALIAGTVAGWVLASSARGLVRPAAAGPAVTIAGAAITFLAVLACASPIIRRAGEGPR
jgi:hypothetical protein